MRFVFVIREILSMGMTFARILFKRWRSIRTRLFMWRCSVSKIIMREKLIQIAVVMLLLLPSVSARAASFYMDGVCYSDTAVLVETWEAKFPYVDGAAGAGGILEYVAYPTTVSAGGLLTSRVDRLNLATGAVTTGFVFSAQLMDCTAKNNLVAVGKVDRTLIIIAMVFSVMIGFNVGRGFFPDKFGGSA